MFQQFPETFQENISGGEVEMTDEEMKEKALQLKAEGKTLAEIAKELDTNKTKVHRLLASVQPPEPEVTYLDVEDRFAKVLRLYSVKDKEIPRIIDYISAQGENAYRDFDILRRCLVEQDVRQVKVGTLLRHWADREHLEFPEALARELEVSSQSPASKAQPDKWIILNNQPVPDKDGPYSFNQALQVIQSQNQGKSSGGNDLVNLLISRMDKSDDRVEKLLDVITDQRFSNLQQQLQTVTQSQSEITKYGVLKGWGDGLLGELRGIRSDAKPLIETAVKAGLPMPRPKSPEERAKISAAGKEAIAQERRARELEDQLLAGDFSTRVTAKPAPPAVIAE
jgi:hypothetical protein